MPCVFLVPCFFELSSLLFTFVRSCGGVIRECYPLTARARRTKNRKRREIAPRRKMSRDAIRPTLDMAAGAISTLLALDVLRLCSSAQTLFLVFDDNYCFLALSASVWTMGKMRDGAQWLSNHYAANDYYCEGEKVVGTWVGKGAEILRIEGRSIEPQDEAFLAIFSGKTPSGEKLKQRDSDIIGYDFQCSVQKSVSIMAILGGDDRLFEAHRAAVTEGYQALETLACIQGRDEQGSKRRTTTGVLCSARFEHDTSPRA